MAKVMQVEMIRNEFGQGLWLHLFVPEHIAVAAIPDRSRTDGCP